MYRIQIKQRRDCYLSDKFMTTDFPVIYPNITNIMRIGTGIRMIAMRKKENNHEKSKS